MEIKPKKPASAGTTKGLKLDFLNLSYLFGYNISREGISSIAGTAVEIFAEPIQAGLGQLQELASSYRYVLFNLGFDAVFFGPVLFRGITSLWQRAVPREEGNATTSGASPLETSIAGTPAIEGEESGDASSQAIDCDWDREKAEWLEGTQPSVAVAVDEETEEGGVFEKAQCSTEVDEGVSDSPEEHQPDLTIKIGRTLLLHGERDEGVVGGSMVWERWRQGLGHEEAASLPLECLRGCKDLSIGVVVTEMACELNLMDSEAVQKAEEVAFNRFTSGNKDQMKLAYCLFMLLYFRHGETTKNVKAKEAAFQMLSAEDKGSRSLATILYDGVIGAEHSELSDDDVTPILDLIESGDENTQACAKKVLAAFFAKNIGVDKAIERVREGYYDDDFTVVPLIVTEELLRKEGGCPELAVVAADLLLESDFARWCYGKYLFKECFKHGIGFDVAKDVVYELFEPLELEGMRRGFELLLLMCRDPQGKPCTQGIEAAKEAAILMFEDDAYLMKIIASVLHQDLKSDLAAITHVKDLGTWFLRSPFLEFCNTAGLETCRQLMVRGDGILELGVLYAAIDSIDVSAQVAKQIGASYRELNEILKNRPVAEEASSDDDDASLVG